MDLVGFEPTTSSMPWKRAPKLRHRPTRGGPSQYNNCVTGATIAPGPRRARRRGNSTPAGGRARTGPGRRCGLDGGCGALRRPGGRAKLSVMTREQAWEILCEFVQNDALRRHALAVETCVVAYARKSGADEAQWSVTALLHDFDWELHPALPDHPMKGEPILAARGVEEEIRRAILSHADFSGVPRVSALEKTLFACDELAGFLTAVSYVKPGRSIHEVDARSVRKKMKDKAFARNVNRDDILRGAAELGVDLDEHITFCIEAMRARAEELGLQGNPQRPAAAEANAAG